MQALASSNPSLFGWLVSHLLSVSDISIAECLGKLMRTCKSIRHAVIHGEALHQPFLFARQARTCWEAHLSDKSDLSFGHPALDDCSANPHNLEVCCRMANQSLLLGDDKTLAARCCFCKDGAKPVQWWIHCAAYRCCTRYPVMYATFDEGMLQLFKDLREGLYWMRQKPRISHPRGPITTRFNLKRDLDDESVCRLCWKNKKMRETRNCEGLIYLCSRCNCANFLQHSRELRPSSRALAKRRRTGGTPL